MATVAIKPLEDTDPMPFGKHKGVRMQDVPAAYFHYLWTSGTREELKAWHARQAAGAVPCKGPSDWLRVAEYIERNLDALRKDHPDGIWT